jgi:hypothetical protein
MASPAYPFYFAWVNETDTTFGSEHEVVNEEIVSFDVKHDEGQCPTLDITVRNPRIGLLHASRKVWAWLSYQSADGHVHPLFFGVLVGIPSDIFGELVTLHFIARSPNFIEDKQKVAETMKVSPYYDPVWLDLAHRDEPDAILEGYSSLWHIDRTTLVTTASDILTGEDGTIDFGENAWYNSLSLKIGQPPLTDIRVEATVKWTQRSAGLLDWPTVSIASYTGGTFMQDWPKAGAGLGGGWSVETSFVNDIYSIDLTPGTNFSYSWQNNSKIKYQCTQESFSISTSGPALLSPDPLNCMLTNRSNPGMCDPYGDPPYNVAAHVEENGIIIPKWFLNCSMTLRYDAKRQFMEELAFDLKANTQSVLTSPLVQQHTELITIAGSDVGEPLLTLDAWSDFAGKAVPLAMMVFPNDPTKPGGMAYQVCTVAGTAGSTEPDFSDIPGTVTVDGTVHWASMGTNPLTNNPNWSPASPVARGEIILFVPQYNTTDFHAGAGNFEPSLTRWTYYICTQPGYSNGEYSTLTYTPLHATSDTAAGIPVHIQYIKEPDYTTTLGATITDGGVTWMCLGQAPALLGIPVGGSVENVTARCYFPTPRGHCSVEYLICKARAHLRHRARAVTVGWDAKFDLGLGLSCRYDARVADPRLPGGEATGKVIAYSLHCDGGGKLHTHVEIGCSVGYGGTVNADAGTGVYASGGYCQSGYQQTVDTVVTPTDNSDVGYTPPVFAGFDDGLSFPLTVREVRAGELISNDAASQANAIQAACPASQAIAEMQLVFTFHSAPNAQFTTTTSGTSPEKAWAIAMAQLNTGYATVPMQMEANPVVWTLFLKPLTNGPFSGSYSIVTSMLELPQGINLEAASSI